MVEGAIDPLLWLMSWPDSTSTSSCPLAPWNGGLPHAHGHSLRFRRRPSVLQHGSPHPGVVVHGGVARASPPTVRLRFVLREMDMS